MRNLPLTKNENIVVQELETETLVYDLNVNKAYCLNETSAAVYNACGNGQTLEDLKTKYSFSDDLIYFALDELKKNDLIQNDYVSPLNGINRRDVIKKVGLASMVALPIITGLVAPKAAQAASSSTTFCTTAGRTCIPAGADPCAGRPDGMYAYSTNPASTDGSCSGTATVNAFYSCPVIPAPFDLCASTTPTAPPV